MYTLPPQPNSEYELRVVLATRPEPPEPGVDYSAQVAAKQGQAAQMQEELHSMA